MLRYTGYYFLIVTVSIVYVNALFLVTLVRVNITQCSDAKAIHCKLYNKKRVCYEIKSF